MHLPAQVPIGAVLDVPLATTNTVTSVSEQINRLLLEDEQGFTSIISDVQDFFNKARTSVNQVIKNMQTVHAIVDIHADIMELYQVTIERLQAPLGEDHSDSIDALHHLDKWKHIQILLAIATEASGALELFDTLLEDDILNMDDKGRIVLIQQIYRDLIRMRSAMRAHIRRINKQIVTIVRARREIIAFEALFN